MLLSEKEVERISFESSKVYSMDGEAFLKKMKEKNIDITNIYVDDLDDGMFPYEVFLDLDTPEKEVCYECYEDNLHIGEILDDENFPRVYCSGDVISASKVYIVY